MDVNGTKFHSLIGRRDWTQNRTRLSGGVRWDEQEACVRLRSRLFHPGADRLAAHLAPQQRRGAAGDRYGNIFWIGDERQDIWFFSREGGAPLAYWSLDDWLKIEVCDGSTGDFKPHDPVEIQKPSFLQGLAVTRHDYLVVGLQEPAGLLIFDLHAGSPPRLLSWPQELPFAPFDMAPALDGGLWILDQGDPPQFWRLNEKFAVCDLGTARIEIGRDAAGIFQPGDTSDACRQRICFPTGVQPVMGSPIDAVRPVSIEALPDDTIMILSVDENLDENAARTTVYHYKDARRLGVYPLNDYFAYLGEDPDGPGEYHLLAQDFVFMPTGDITADGPDGMLYVSAANRKQTFVFDLTITIAGLSLALQDRYYPMRTTQGRALVAAGGNVFYDAGDKWLPLIAQGARFYNHGQVTTRNFDGKQHGCVWHRLFLDAIIPEGAGIAIQCMAADDEKLLPNDTTADSGAWQEQPRPYLRTIGSDIAFHNPYPEGTTVHKNSGTWEVLLHQATGRFLKVRLKLTSTGRNTPRIRALRVYYPRFSYLNEYLPAVYRDDDTSADFLERFLANVEGLFTTIEDRIAWAQVLFDVGSVPAEFLDWLIGWFEVIQQEGWGEGRRRLWLAHAMELFSQRGTVPGIIRAVRLATDPCPDETLFTENVTAYYHPVCAAQRRVFSGFHVRIVENFLLRQAPGVTFGDPTKTEKPGIYTEDQTWEPEYGVERLHDQYRSYLVRKYYNIGALNTQWETQYNAFADIQLPPLKPEHEIIAEGWLFFLQNELPFAYTPVACNKADTVAYQNYLARRYRTISQLNTAWTLSAEDEYQSFGTVQLPVTMPSQQHQLNDWIQFVSRALSTSRLAHQFTVLVPTAFNADNHWNGPDPDMVRRIVEMEKPAHTRFDVKQYFAMFRVGEARLGMESVMEPSRPLQEAVLGDYYLAEGFLSLPPAWQAPNRLILGRDTLEIT